MCNDKLVEQSVHRKIARMDTHDEGGQENAELRAKRGNEPPLPEPTLQPDSRPAKRPSIRETYLAPAAVPVCMLRGYPAMVDCPYCGRRALTSIEHKAGLVTFAVCVGMCLVPALQLGCCLLPFCVDTMQDVEHRCGACGRMVSTYERL